MKLLLVVAALALTFPVASAQEPPTTFVGVHISKTTIKTPGRNPFAKMGDVIVNELVVYPNPDKPEQLRAFVSRIHENGDGCQLHGDVTVSSRNSFTVSETSFGSTCTLKVRRNGGQLTVTEQSRSCALSCGSGVFTGASYKKICSTIEPSLPDKLSDRIIAREGVTYGPGCTTSKE